MGEVVLSCEFWVLSFELSGPIWDVGEGRRAVCGAGGDGESLTGLFGLSRLFGWAEQKTKETR
jgi:hypothetical protein